jgi:serine/threonine protein kinase
MMTSEEDDASPKFIDFGLSKVFYKGETSDDRFGTLAFCSPEIILGKQHTIVTDIWSIGVLMYFLLVAEIPFLSRDKNQTKKNIVWQKLNFQTPHWQKISI